MSEILISDYPTGVLVRWHDNLRKSMQSPLSEDWLRDAQGQLEELEEELDKRKPIKKRRKFRV
jgi:hypothetical protein